MNRLSVKKRTWQESFEALVNYKNRHGDCLVPIHNYQEDLALGGWVNHQRSKKNKLTPEQHQKLEGIGFAWSVRARNKTWNVMIESLQKFKGIHGNVEVPEDYEADRKLAEFVKEQRSKYHKGQLSAARLKQLEEIGMVLREAKEEEEEHLVASQQEEEEDEQEDNIENSQQTNGQEESGEDEEEEDEDMIRYDNAFKQQYQKLVDFNIKFGHCRVPKFSRRGDTLGLWVSALRRKRAENPRRGMEPRCLELLEELEFFDSSQFPTPKMKPPVEAEEDETDSEPEVSDDEDVFADAAEEDAEEEEEEEMSSSEVETEVSENEEEEEKVEDAVSEDENSDSESKASSISNKEETDAEEETTVESNSDSKKRRLSDASAKRCNYRDERFMKQYNDLVEFKRVHGHCRVPQSKKFKTLGGWVNNLRVMHNRDPENGVRPDRRKMLDEVGFIWNAGADRPGNDARWEEQYKNLLEFRSKFSHCRVPQTGPHRKLGRWVATQRALYVKDPANGIRADRLKRLNDIEFTWDAKGFKGRHFYSLAASDKPPAAAAAKAESSATESDDDGPVAAAQVDEDRPGVVMSAPYVAEAFRSSQMFAAGLYPPVQVFPNMYANHPIYPGAIPIMPQSTMVPMPASVPSAGPLLVSSDTESLPASAAARPPLVSPDVEAKPLVKQVSLD